MIVVRFGPGSLGNLRFALSPLTELMRSVAVLADPARQALHLPWIAETRRRLHGLDLAPLQALGPPGRYSPDFASPPPATPLAELEDELAAMTATPPERIRAEVRRAHRGHEVPAALRPLVDDPATGVHALAGLMRSYWERALAPHWPRVRALLDGDILHRARRMADGGAERLFADLDPAVRWKDGVLRIDKRVEHTLTLGDEGLLLMPSVFVWPAVVLVTDPAWQPAIVYPARGVGALWEPERVDAPAALAALVGRSRAGLLLALARPRSTTDLARALGITPGGASQHLAVLRDAGLVHGHRVGRLVLYLRTPAGERLVEAAGPAGARPAGPAALSS